MVQYPDLETRKNYWRLLAVFLSQRADEARAVHTLKLISAPLTSYTPSALGDILPSREEQIMECDADGKECVRPLVAEFVDAPEQWQTTISLENRYFNFDQPEWIAEGRYPIIRE